MCYTPKIESRSIEESLNDHIDIRHHFIHNLVEDKVISLEFVSLEGQITYILTKPLDTSRSESLRKSIHLCTLC